MYRPLWIEIQLGALKGNLKAIHSCLSKNVSIMATLKQEAYGHGLLPVAGVCAEEGIGFFGLGSLEEALLLRKHRFRQHLLILSVVDTQFAKQVVALNVRPTVVDFAFAKALQSEAKKQKKKIPIHVKIDTGMGRLGVWHAQALPFIKRLTGLDHLILEGLYTHFPCADTDRKLTRSQIKIFNRVIGQLTREGITFKYLHCANSVALLKYKEARFNLVRPGLALYGIKPYKTSTPLRPILSLHSRVIYTKKVGKGRSISYGSSYVTKQPTTIATVAVGYADGYPWILSNNAKVIIRDRFCPIAGRVCMDHIMVDVGNVSVKVGDRVTLLGKARTKGISAQEMASWAKTISYEIVSRFSLKIPRIYK